MLQTCKLCFRSESDIVYMMVTQEVVRQGKVNVYIVDNGKHGISVRGICCGQQGESEHGKVRWG